MSRKQRRLSDEAAAVLRLFVEESGRERFGLEIIKAASIKSGSLYPILHRFEERRLILAQWEDIETAALARRRPRRKYRLNPDQAEHARGLYEGWRAQAGAKQPAARRRTPRLGEAM
jgi:DNA-binding PadR family transcriptional regulator